MTEDKPSPTQRGVFCRLTPRKAWDSAEDTTMSKRARTRAVRAEMARTGENYTRAATQVGHAGADAPALPRDDDPLRLQQHVRNVLEAVYALDQAHLGRLEQLERDGHRIVDGGQIGQKSWEVTDWRTGQQLAVGHDGLEEYEEVCERLGVPGKWFHRDHVDDEVFAVVDTPGVPATLAESLQEWVEQSGTPDSEIAELAGWPVEKVHRLRG